MIHNYNDSVKDNKKQVSRGYKVWLFVEDPVLEPQTGGETLSRF